MRSLHDDRRHVPRTVHRHARGRPHRHPRGQRRRGQRRQQLGRRRPCVAAAVGQRPLQEGLVVRAESGAQGVQEHQPVLGPLRRPRLLQQGARGGRVAGAQGGEQRDPLGEEALLPEPPYALRVAEVRRRGAAAGGRAQGEPPVRVEPGQPQRARAREPQRRRTQVGAAPRGVEQGGECVRGRRVAVGVRRLEPLRQQLHQVRGRTPAAAAGRAGTVGEQHREPACGGGRQRRPRVLGGGARPLGGPRGAQPGPPPYGRRGDRVEQGRRRPRSGRRARRGAPVGAQQSRGHQLLPVVREGRGHGGGRPAHELPLRRGSRCGRSLTRTECPAMSERCTGVAGPVWGE